MNILKDTGFDIKKEEAKQQSASKFRMFKTHNPEPGPDKKPSIRHKTIIPGRGAGVIERGKRDGVPYEEEIIDPIQPKELSEGLKKKIGLGRK